MYDNINDFLMHTALRFHQARLVGKETYESRRTFIHKIAKEVKAKPRRMVDKQVREMCKVICRTPTHAHWIYDQYFQMIHSMPPCLKEFCYDLSKEVVDEYSGKTNNIDQGKKLMPVYKGEQNVASLGT